MTNELSIDDDCTESARAKQAVTRRIREEALRQLQTVDIDDPDSRVEQLPLLCLRLPEELMRDLQD